MKRIVLRLAAVVVSALLAGGLIHGGENLGAGETVVFMLALACLTAGGLAALITAGN